MITWTATDGEHCHRCNEVRPCLVRWTGTNKRALCGECLPLDGALPVLRTCGDCGHCSKWYCVLAPVGASEMPRRTDPNAAPPDWCPLRANSAPTPRA